MGNQLGHGAIKNHALTRIKNVQEFVGRLMEAEHGGEAVDIITKSAEDIANEITEALDFVKQL